MSRNRGIGCNGRQLTLPNWRPTPKNLAALQKGLRPDFSNYPVSIDMDRHSRAVTVTPPDVQAQAPAKEGSSGKFASMLREAAEAGIDALPTPSPSHRIGMIREAMHLA